MKKFKPGKPKPQFFDRDGDPRPKVRKPKPKRPKRITPDNYEQMAYE
jgi:hypothetical protein